MNKMNKIIIIFAIILSTMLVQVQSKSCDIHRGACIASCIAQNCATGKCVKGTCVCVRCDKGHFLK
jgi:hypothetical protein